MKATHTIAFILLVIGGLNWLLIGLFSWGIGNILSEGVARAVYIIVGLATVYVIFTHKKTCMMCDKSSVSSVPPSSAPQM